jgi:hypothetical protein
MGDGLNIRMTEPEVNSIIRYGDFMKRVRKIREHNEALQRKAALDAGTMPSLPEQQTT